MNVAVFFTYNISLVNWIDLGIYSREMQIYKNISESSEANFTFLTFGDKQDLLIKDHLFNYEIIPIYNKIKKTKTKSLNFLKTLILPFKLKKDLKNIDLIKTNQLNGAWSAIILKFLLKKPLIVRTGYDLLSFAIKEKKSFYKRIFYYFLTQISLIFSDKYLVSSNADKEFLKKYFISTNKIEVSYNWILPGNKYNSGKRYDSKLLAVGRLEKQKNYHEMIKNFSDSNYQIDIVGEGSQKKELMDLAKSNNVKINFLGTLNHPDLINLYKEYKFFLLFSKFEGNPKVLIEAMGMGCIPIVNNDKNILEIIKNYETGIVIDVKKDRVVPIIDRLNRDFEKTKIMSENIFNITNKKFSIENNIKFEIELYKELIKN